MAVSQDAAKGWFLPANSAEWTELLAGTGIPNPIAGYGFQEASGSPQDSIGTRHLTAAGTLAYQYTVSGWTRKAIRTTTGSIATMVNSTFANVNATNYTVLLIARAEAGGLGGGTNRTLMRFGDFFNADFAVELALVGADQRLQLGNGATRITGANDPLNIDQRFYLRIGDTADTLHLTTEQEDINNDAAANTGSGTQLCFGGDNSQTWLPGTVNYLFAAVWTTTLDDTQLAALNDLIETGPSGGSTPGRGPDGDVLFVLDTEIGGEVSYSYATDIIRTRDGKENRIATIGCPREAYTFKAHVNDAELGVFQAAVARYGATASPVLVALMHDAISLSVETAGASLTVTDTDQCDWCYVGSRVITIAPNGAYTKGVIQSFTSTTIDVDVAVGAAGKRGALVMPTMPCYLDPQQSVEQYAVNAGTVTLKARAILFGNEDSDWDPRGAPAVTTYTDPETSIVYPVWDRFIVVQSTVGRAQMLGTEFIDRGAVFWNVALLAQAESIRGMAFTVRDPDSRQWFKSFIGTVRGRQKAFFLPTWKPDLVPLSDASTATLTVVGPPSAVDYANTWWESTQRWLMLTRTDGTVHYRKVYDAADNGDGTQDILLDSPLAGALASVSIMELCRFESDEFVLIYDAGAIARVEMSALTVQR